MPPRQFANQIYLPFALHTSGSVEQFVTKAPSAFITVQFIEIHSNTPHIRV